MTALGVPLLTEQLSLRNACTLSSIAQNGLKNFAQTDPDDVRANHPQRRSRPSDNGLIRQPKDYFAPGHPQHLLRSKATLRPHRSLNFRFPATSFVGNFAIEASCPGSLSNNFTSSPYATCVLPTIISTRFLTLYFLVNSTAAAFFSWVLNLFSLTPRNVPS